MYRLIVFFAVVVLLVSCNGKSKTGVTTVVEDEPLEYSRQVQSAIEYFEAKGKGNSTDKHSFQSVKKDSLDGEFSVIYEKKIVYVQSRDTILKAIFYDREIVHPLNLRLANGENSLSNLFHIPLIDSDPTLRRFGFWVHVPNMDNYLQVYIELKNDDASKGITLEQFLDNATLTYISEYMLVI